MINFKKVLMLSIVALSMATTVALEPAQAKAERANERIVVFEKEKVTLINPFARKAKKGQNSAAFVVIQNNCEVGCRIVKARSPIANTVELHTSFEDNGVHKMRPVKFIALPGKTEDKISEVELKSGGYHVMLIDLNQDIEAGTEIPVTLEMSNGNTLTAAYKVKGCCGHCHGPSQ
ncbi:MAG TPA: hypothetical protein DD412_00715 [Holosporales bacterium]|nr:hypothetical protein [Holosporales bacterium]